MCKRWGAAVGPYDNLALCCWPACQQVNSFAIALCVSAAFTTGDSVVSIAGLIVLAVHSVYIQGGFVACSLDTRECSCRYVFVTSVGDLWRGGEQSSSEGRRVRSVAAIFCAQAASRCGNRALHSLKQSDVPFAGTSVDGCFRFMIVCVLVLFYMMK